MVETNEAYLLRIYIGDSDRYMGKPLYKFLLEFFRKEGFAGATVLRGISGFGKTSIIHTASILRLSTDLPIVIEIVDKIEKIEKVLPVLKDVVKEGLITIEKVGVVFYNGNKKDNQTLTP
ncbi:hypothetical protein Asulf_01653 [Archaeoglobus sulfaticallidus PM70-1]|uniref:Uncharacterized protein n=1 Tax=Archaeoglobus sulfaticallidus PM70-1 TaxID=387631 RepID=N0BH58_9EURY|nr:hypothetical protein Asulf_01653 [Archaeoglobus sulfaticallidus PM70-1]